MDKKKKNTILAIAAATGGLSAAMIAAHVAAYDKIFERYNRPDYTTTFGMVCVDRLDNKVKREEISFYSDGVLLKGNYFISKKPKGLVLMAHGIHAG